MAEEGKAKTLWSLSWPLMISFTARALLSSIDLPYASRLDNPDAAIAGIGLSFPLEFSFIACWVGTSAALTSHLSKAFGEQNEARIAQLLRTTKAIVIALGALFLAMAGAIYGFAEHLLPAQLGPDVIENFRLYAPVLLAGVAILGFWSTIPDSIVKAHHDTRSTMVAGLISGIGNLVFNTIFLFGFGWGIAGIALATGLARGGSLVYALVRAAKLEAARRAQWAEEEATPRTKPAPQLTSEGLFRRPLWAMLVLAVPSALTFVLMGTENFAINFVLGMFPNPDPAIAAYAIYHKVVALGLMPIIATGVAILPFVARHVGSGNLVEVSRGLRQAFVLSLAWLALLVAPLCFLGGNLLAGFLSEGETTTALASFVVRYLVPLAGLVATPFMLCRPVFEAVQRGGPGLLMATLRYVVLGLPCAIVGATLAEGWGYPPLYGLAFGLVTGSSLVSLTFVLWLWRLLGQLGRGEGTASQLRNRAVGSPPEAAEEADETRVYGFEAASIEELAAALERELGVRMFPNQSPLIGPWFASQDPAALVAARREGTPYQPEPPHLQLVLNDPEPGYTAPEHPDGGTYILRVSAPAPLLRELVEKLEGLGGRRLVP